MEIILFPAPHFTRSYSFCFPIVCLFWQSVHFSLFSFLESLFFFSFLSFIMVCKQIFLNCDLFLPRAPLFTLRRLTTDLFSPYHAGESFSLPPPCSMPAFDFAFLRFPSARSPTQVPFPLRSFDVFAFPPPGSPASCPFESHSLTPLPPSYEVLPFPITRHPRAFGLPP